MAAAKQGACRPGMEKARAPASYNTAIRRVNPAPALFVFCFVRHFPKKTNHPGLGWRLAPDLFSRQGGAFPR
jgi:hypothetical protein